MDMRSLMPFGRSTDALRSAGDQDPFAQMRQEMDRLFDNFTREFGGGDWRLPMTLENGVSSPRVDVAETEKGLEISAELPGVTQKDIDLDLADGILTLKATHERKKEEKDEKRHYHLVERSHGSYLRRFAIPFEPDADNVAATFDNGILHITVPRSPKAVQETKKIQINGG